MVVNIVIAIITIPLGIAILASEEFAQTFLVYKKERDETMTGANRIYWGLFSLFLGIMAIVFIATGS